MLPEIADGMIAPPSGPGLGTELLAELHLRADATVRSGMAQAQAGKGPTL